MPKQNMKSPDERAEAVDKAQRRARKSYRKNINKKRGNLTEAELIVVKDQLVSLKLVGYSNSQCASIVGLSKGQVGEIVKDANFQKRLMSLHEKLPQAAIQLGKAYLVEAVQWVVDVGRTTKDEDKRLKAAAELFDRFGVAKVSKNEIKDTTPVEGGEPDELPSTFMEKLRQAPPELQEKVVELQESFLEGVERILTEGSNGDS